MSARHGPSFSAQKMSKKDLKASFGKMGLSMKKYWGWMIFAIIILIASVVVAIYAPTITKDLTNTINDGATAHLTDPNQGVDMDKVKTLSLTLIGMYVGSALVNFISNYILVTVTMRYAQSLRTAIGKKINLVPLRYFDSNSIGDILSRLTNDVDQIGQSLQQSIGMVVQSVFMIVGVLIAMFITSWQMALVCVATLPLMMLFLLFILKIAGPRFIKRQDLLGEVESQAEENYNGQMVIKLFNAEERSEADFDKTNMMMQKAMFEAEICGGLMQPIMGFVGYLGYAAVCLTGGLLMNAGDAGMDIGTITAFLTYVNLFLSPLSQLAQAMNSLQSAAASSKRVYDFLAEKELEDESDKNYLFAPHSERPVGGEVIFDHVSFGYDETREIIHDFSAKVTPGMKVAIVGPTGAGKTTMVNLLMRFYEVGEGRILIDGVDMKTMKREEIHDIFGMVLQDTWVFDGTLKENLIYNTEGVTDEDIKNVIHDAHLTHFVRGLPGGLDYEIKDDNSISGGQRQLITIARAMLKKAPLMILDEATSNVDTRTEEKIQEAMDRLTKGKTSFVIAHRLSTIRNADLILVMKDGNIVEQGNHDSLMEANGFYASLYNSQFALE